MSIMHSPARMDNILLLRSQEQGSYITVNTNSRNPALLLLLWMRRNQARRSIYSMQVNCFAMEEIGPAFELSLRLRPAEASIKVLSMQLT